MKTDYCVVCSTTESLEQHHVVPRSLFKTDADYNIEKNLITVCPRCHGLLHGQYRGKRWSNNHRELMRLGKERTGNYGGRPKKLTVEQRKDIKQRLKDGESKKKLSEEYQVSRATILNIEREK